jgi:short-subunit dehydrogenase
MKSYSTKTALVTGASMGIGKSLATDLAKRGARLVLVARSADKLEQLAQELKVAHGAQVSVIAMDLAAPRAAADLYAEVKARGLSVDLLVNNAGFGKWGHFGDCDPATYAGMIDLNITSVVELCHAFLPGMVKKGDCGILNIGSTASFVPVPWSAVYAATKAFVLSFSEALAHEYRDRGVQVTCLCPGATASNFAAVANPAAAHSNDIGDSPDMVAKVGLDALLAGRSSVIAGASNQMVGVLPRLLPRKMALQIVAKAWRGILKSRGVEV